MHYGYGVFVVCIAVTLLMLAFGFTCTIYGVRIRGTLTGDTIPCMYNTEAQSDRRIRRRRRSADVMIWDVHTKEGSIKDRLMQ